MSKHNDSRDHFSQSLGSDFAERYTADVKNAVQRIASRRGEGVEVGVFESRPDLTGVCIVCADRPGLLSRITEAFVICGLDVLSAEAFTRASETPVEALDLFWLRRFDASGAARALSDQDVEQVRSTLIGLLDGSLEPRISPIDSGRDGSSNTRVRFIEDDNGVLTTLEIETEDRSGLLLSISRALFAQRVQIVRSEVRTLGRRVVDRFKIEEFDGSPVGESRRLEIQVAVLSAAEPAKRLSSVSSAPPSSLNKK
jgi:UTP:GlnB (protein PII) uridylyltransferase